MRIHLIIATLSLLAFGCKSVKPEQVNNDLVVEEIKLSDNELSFKEKEIPESTSKSILDWEYLSARYDTEISDGKDFNQTISMNIRMKKDSILWFTASMAFFKLATGIITKDSIYILDHINSKYFPLSTVNNIGIPLPNLFQNIQELLFIGNPISEIKTWENNMYRDSFDYQNRKDSIPSTVYYFTKRSNSFIDSQSFSFLTSSTFSDNNLQTLISFTYPERDDSDIKFPIPKTSKAELQQNDQLRGRLKFELRTARFDRITSYPFSIPDGYEKSSL